MSFKRTATLVATASVAAFVALKVYRARNSVCKDGSKCTKQQADAERKQDAKELKVSTQRHPQSSPAHKPHKGNKHRPVVFCGPSGVGKGTLLSMLQKEYPGVFQKAVTHTTRKPRQGEVDGVHYHFTDPETMKREIAEGKFVESAIVHTNMYGLSVRAILDVQESGRIPIIELDIQGAETIYRTQLNPYFVFILPPTFETLEQRLKARGTETPETIAKRLETARVEMARYGHLDFWHHKQENNDLDVTYHQLRGVLERFFGHIHTKRVASGVTAADVLSPRAKNAPPASGSAGSAGAAGEPKKSS